MASRGDIVEKKKRVEPEKRHECVCLCSINALGYPDCCGISNPYLCKKKKNHTYEETDGAFYTTKKTKGFALVLEDDPLKERKGMI